MQSCSPKMELPHESKLAHDEAKFSKTQRHIPAAIKVAEETAHNPRHGRTILDTKLNNEDASGGAFVAAGGDDDNGTKHRMF